MPAAESFQEVAEISFTKVSNTEWGGGERKPAENIPERAGGGKRGRGRRGEEGREGRKSGAWGGGGSEGKEGKDEGFGLKYQACIC